MIQDHRHHRHGFCFRKVRVILKPNNARCFSLTANNSLPNWWIAVPDDLQEDDTLFYFYLFLKINNDTLLIYNIKRVFIFLFIFYLFLFDLEYICSGGWVIFASFTGLSAEITA